MCRQTDSARRQSVPGPGSGGARTSRELGFIAVIALALISGIPAGIDFGLWLDSLRFPFNGTRDGQKYTWGHPVVLNSSGFRDREFLAKPAGTWRVLVLGDSITYGTGLATGERYTNLVEEHLRARFVGKRIEVANLAMPGINTEDEAYMLEHSIEPLDPDLVVIGFCINDPQLGGTRDSPARDRLRWLFTGFHHLRFVGLRRLAVFLDVRVHRLLTRVGVLPDNSDVIQDAYDPASPAWMRFVTSLEHIRSLNDRHGLPKPIFAVLAAGAPLAGAADPDFPDASRQLRIRLYGQAKAAARQVGFVTVGYLREIESEFSASEMAVNPRDNHPSAKLNRLYARKLAPVIAHALLESGR